MADEKERCTMFWLIVIGIFVAVAVVSGVVWHSIDRVGSSSLPGYVKFLIIGAIVAACLALRFML